MKITWKFIAILIAIIAVLGGCATVQEPEIWVSTTESDIVYTIDLFDDANGRKDKEKFPDAAKAVTGAFETAFLQSGYIVRKKGEEDAVVTGVVRSYYRGSFWGRYTTVGFEVKAADSKTGEVFWKASHTKTTRWEYDYDPALLAIEVAKEITEKLTN